MIYYSVDYGLLMLLILFKLSQIGPLGASSGLFDMFPSFFEDFSAFWHKISQSDFCSLMQSLN